MNRREKAKQVMGGVVKLRQMTRSRMAGYLEGKEYTKNLMKAAHKVGGTSARALDSMDEFEFQMLNRGRRASGRTTRKY